MSAYKNICSLHGGLARRPGNARVYLIPLILILYSFLVSCARENVFDEPPDYPVIDSISPGMGTLGTQFRLYGTGFSSTPEENIVSINGRAVRVDSPSSSTVLLVTIVESTGSGPVVISVNDKSSEGPVFTYLGDGDGPVITAVNQGWNDGSGYSISVSAVPPSDSDITLFINGVLTSFDYATRPGHPYYSPDAGPQLRIMDETIFEEHIPSNYADVHVVVRGMASNTWRYFLRPEISHIQSRAGEWLITGNDMLTITGRFFGDMTSSASVAFVGLGGALNPPEVVSWQNSEIILRTHDYDVIPGNAIAATVIVGTNESYAAYCTYAGIISATAILVAGGQQGDEDGSGANARFDGPFGITVDAHGFIYVSEEYNHRIRRITQDGEVSTYAGSSAGFLNGTRLQAQFNRPLGISSDPYGNLYVADAGNNLIRGISSAGAVTTIMGSGSTSDLWNPAAVAFSMNQRIFIADFSNHRIREWSVTGSVNTVAGGPTSGFVDGPAATARFNQPYGIAINQPNPLVGFFNQRIYVADEQNRRIRLISNGSVVTLAGSGTSGKADGQGASAQFEVPRGLALDAQGNLYVADYWNSRIRKVTPDGVVTSITAVFPDNGGLALFAGPTGISIDYEGNLYVADHAGNAVYKLTFD